jgi:hypothetical protein
MVQQNPKQELSAVLDFTPNDLAANRAGELSPRQQARLSRMRQRTWLIGLAAALILALVATALLFTGRRNDSAILTIVGIGLTICGTAMLGIFVRYWLRLSADLEGGQVEVISGSTERVIRVMGRITTYMLQVGDARLSLDRDTLKIFDHETGYHIYQSRHAGILLSAEKSDNQDR